MTWSAETTKIWAGLRDRFLLRETSVAQPMLMSNTIVPVTDADRILRKLTIVNTLISITGVGNAVLDTVPQGKRRIYHAFTITSSSGTWTFTILYLINPTGNAVRIKNIATATTSLFYYPSDIPFHAESGWTLAAYIDSYAVTGDLSYTTMYEEEEAY